MVGPDEDVGCRCPRIDQRAPGRVQHLFALLFVSSIMAASFVPSYPLPTQPRKRSSRVPRLDEGPLRRPLDV